MNNVIFYILLIIVAMGVNIFPADSHKQEWVFIYDGDIGVEFKIRMSLEYENDSIKGSYFYMKHLTDIQLKGSLHDKNKITLIEHDSSGVPTGLFDCLLIDSTQYDPRKGFNDKHEPLDKEIISGSWKSLKNNVTLPLYLALSYTTFRQKGTNRYAVAGADDDVLIERNAYKFLLAIRDNNKKMASSFIVFPIKVTIKNRMVNVAKKIDFIKYFDDIFTMQFKRQLSTCVPQAMFARDIGIMLGNGDIWFNAEGKVIAINN